MSVVAFLEGNRRGATVRAMEVARELGHRALLLSADPAYYDGSAESPVDAADEVVRVDTYDVALVLEALDGIEVAGALAFDDYHLIPAALVAETLGLPHVPVEGLRRARFKDLTRRALDGRTGNPAYVVHELDRGGTPDPPAGYPCVVKPVDDGGSFSVRVCSDRGELEQALAAAASRRRNARGYRLAPRVLVEQYVDGPEFSCELLWDTALDDWRVLGFTRKRTTPPPYAVELEHVFPHRFGGGEGARVEEHVRGWLAALGLERGAAHVELRLRGDEPVLIEVNPRLSGGMIDRLISLATGLDVAEAYLRLHVGAESRLTPPSKPGSAIVRYLVPPGPGRARAVAHGAPPEGVEWHLGAEREVAAVASGSDRLGFVIASGADERQARARLDDALRGVEVSVRPPGA